MAHDKARDDLLFNCGQQHEIDYVAHKYTDPTKAAEIIKKGCSDGTIKHWTHKKLYDYLGAKGLKNK